MTEDEAMAWVAARVDADAMAKIERFVAMVIDENGRQNLISPGTIPVIWQRHVADSLQLLELAGGGQGRWMDIGSGGGFPGIVLALAGVGIMTMVEPRKRRVMFLNDCIASLAIPSAEVMEAKVEAVTVRADVITARAVASVEKLLLAAGHCCTPTTRWLLPRGATALGDLPSQVEARGMMFHVEQSVTESTSSIVILDGCPR
ncbi:16S rRNA (guanine(527)-N(7))-methyltransferase RsmG [Sphingomonas sp. Leaf343]|uniref:16S rRNA (guanine(527)-N(7))-methyltransferase RsmG n=1 Tax=Sphingomonas sp. Leaf343 TaxID=1736345 RepID=UPI0006F669CA|nr:16S rRNA (guanine(527)-N(7))-methyltransferase RsmG [Sphingomonas sp. Leaf343]KQR83613.1 hypothetical protein ASG07_07880 [Sphingomonas sp. Leaf343]